VDVFIAVIIEPRHHRFPLTDQPERSAVHHVFMAHRMKIDKITVPGAALQAFQHAAHHNLKHFLRKGVENVKIIELIVVPISFCVRLHGMASFQPKLLKILIGDMHQFL